MWDEWGDAAKDLKEHLYGMNALAVYHTALATARKKNHNLVSERRVDEAWLVEYNPHCLEAMESNMAIRLVMYTLKCVIDYITKGEEE